MPESPDNDTDDKKPKEIHENNEIFSEEFREIMIYTGFVLLIVVLTLIIAKTDANASNLKASLFNKLSPDHKTLVTALMQQKAPLQKWLKTVV